ncbi:MAG: caspase family protein [Bacteroidota bacterium]
MPESVSVQLPFKNSFAFLIGNDEYLHVAKLSTAVQDARDIKELLEQEHQYQVEFFQDTTQADLRAVFARMEEVITEEDRVIFYYAGHGIAFESETNPQGYLVPVDAEKEGREKLVSMDELHDCLRSLPCKHGLLILDCCFAGSFQWSSGFRSLELKGEKEDISEERFRRFVTHNAWQVLTSSAHDQVALDAMPAGLIGTRENPLAKFSDAETTNSPFAAAIKQAIQGAGQADVAHHTQGDGVVTFSELFLFIRNFVEHASLDSIGRRQTPSRFTLTSHDTKGEFIFLPQGHRLNLPKAPDHNPYLGLHPYNVPGQEAPTFAGRSDAIKELMQLLDQTSLLVITAPSGQGKSSVVKAGLLPELQNKAAYQAAPMHLFRPGNKQWEDWGPLQDLNPAEPALVLIDQYEEMFTEAEEAATEMEEILLGLIRNLQDHEGKMGKPAPLKLLLTIRSDFEWQLQTSAFGQAFWKEAEVLRFLYRLPPMNREELREVMLRPAWSITYDFESDALVDQILDEVQYAPGALPLLSFTLHKLYEHRNHDQRLFTQHAYSEVLKGVGGALSAHADEVYALKLPEPFDPDQLLHQLLKEVQADILAHQDLMKKLILRMVRLNDGSYSRRRIYRNLWNEKTRKRNLDELNFPDHLDETVERVLAILVEQQIIVANTDKQGNYVEPIHDSLINFWPRCLQWIQEMGRDKLVLQRDLWKGVRENHQWKPEIVYGAQPQEPLWDNHPKLQQVQIAVCDPKDRWLCKKGWADSSIADYAFLLFGEAPTQDQLALLGRFEPYHWTEEEQRLWGDPETAGYSQRWVSDEALFQRIQGQMDAWLNEYEVAFVRKSFRAQRSALEQAIAEKIKAKELQRLAEEREQEVRNMAQKMGAQMQAFKKNFQQQSRIALYNIQAGVLPKLFLIVVGIDEYSQELPKLGGCINDVSDVANSFRTQKGKLFEEVHCVQLTDEKATKATILEAVQEAQMKASPLDYVLLYFSGHGMSYQAEGGGETKTVGAFLPYDTELSSEKGRVGFGAYAPASSLTGEELCEELFAFSSKVILVLDIVGGGEFLAPLVKANQSDDPNRISHNVFGLSACSPGEMSYERKLEDKMRGVFSYAFTRSFRTKEADLDGNGVLYLDELYRYTHEFVRQRVEKQHVFAIAPGTMSNIPLIQLGDQFAFPKAEIALSGHIEDDAVIEGIMATYLPRLPQKLQAQHASDFGRLGFEKYLNVSPTR